MDDIVITGIGIISACGIGREVFWQNCLQGKTGIAPIQSFDTSDYSSHLGAEIRDFNPKDFMPPLKYRRMSRVSRLAVAASIEALQDAGLIISAGSAQSTGVFLGTGYGSTAQTDEFFLGMLKEGPEGGNPSLFPDTVPNAPASQISIYHGIKGPNITFSHNEVSGEQALAYAYRFLLENRAEVCLAGSVDELSAVLFHSFAAVRALSPRDAHAEGMRPFDRKRNGRVLGEGAGVLVMEKRSHAIARGAKIYGTLVAYSSTGSGIGIPHYEIHSMQMARAIKNVLEWGGISPAQIDYICAAANSTMELDRAESLAIQKALNPFDRGIPISSIRGHIGDFCGSGALRTASLLLAMRDGKIPPTLGLRDLEFDLNVVSEKPIAKQIQYALMNGFSFGGSNLCLLFKNEMG
jgi:3-oxoacyl-[acyl-carrier-protein] synthase II